jgi:addiction module HigA family antidote
MMMKPPLPGETLKEEYLVPLGMSVNALARELGVGAARLNEIVLGRRGVSADTALRLARYFVATPGTMAEPAGVLRPAHGPTKGWPDHRAHNQAAPGSIIATPGTGGLESGPIAGEPGFCLERLQ